MDMMNKSKPSALDEQVARQIAVEQGIPMERARSMVQRMNEFHSLAGEAREAETPAKWDNAMERLKACTESMKRDEPDLHARMGREISETIAGLPIPPIPSDLLKGLNPPEKPKKKG